MEEINPHEQAQLDTVKAALQQHQEQLAAQHLREQQEQQQLHEQQHHQQQLDHQQQDLHHQQDHHQHDHHQHDLHQHDHLQQQQQHHQEHRTEQELGHELEQHQQQQQHNQQQQQQQPLQDHQHVYPPAQPDHLQHHEHHEHEHHAPPPHDQHASPMMGTPQHVHNQHIPVGGPNVAPQAPLSVINDPLVCQWLACGHRGVSAEALYDHVCNDHVGRKSTNNLNLTCHWGNCVTTTVKRDHITSHIRVHVPLKPHKCEECGKAFKRPQDLKKHQKTHADGSVLIRSPDQNMQNRGTNNGYQNNNGKPPAGYYGPGQDMSQPHPYPQPHPAHMANNQFNNYAQPQQSYSGYGQVNYPAPATNSVQDLQSMDTRKRAIEALNDFLGDIKRRAIDPTSYYDVGQRLQTPNLPLPISTGFGYSSGNTYTSTQNTGSSYNHNSSQGLFDSLAGSAPGMMGNTHAAPMTQGYSLNLPNARTKNDLQDIDRFLEQLQATVYENSTSSAAAGVQQPGLHTQYPGFNNHYRNSDSPPDMQYGAPAAVASMANAHNLSNLASSASALDTPALTPNSATSYASSSHSPMSTHSRASMSSNNGNALYPTLPSVTAVSDMGSGYPSTTSAPPSGLGSAFDAYDGRRYSGGRLQREAPAAKEDNAAEADVMDMDDGSKTPRNAKEAEDRPDSSALDPALRSTPVPTPSAPASSVNSNEGDKSQEKWVENIRTIESLRAFIRERLERQEYESDEDAEQGASSMDPMLEQQQQQPEPMADQKDVPTVQLEQYDQQEQHMQQDELKQLDQHMQQVQQEQHMQQDELKQLDQHMQQDQHEQQDQHMQQDQQQEQQHVQPEDHEMRQTEEITYPTLKLDA